jgi:hypothetical protein
MKKRVPKLSIATAIALLSLVIKTDRANSSVLCLGKYGLLENKLETIISGDPESLLDNFSTVNNNLSLQSKLSNLASVETLSQQLQNYKFFLNPTNKTLDRFVKKLPNLPIANQINNSIQDRYQGLIDSDEGAISLIEANKLLTNSDNEIGAEFNSSNPAELQQRINDLKSQGWAGEILEREEEIITFPLPIIAGIILLVATHFAYTFAPLFQYLGQAFDEGVVENLRDKYGNPKVPDSQVLLHDRFLKELNKIALKLEKLDNEKFGDREFLLYVGLKTDLARGTGEYKELYRSIQLLDAGIVTQASFLRLEQTELRFRSRKQQEFYQFIVDSIDDNLNKELFKDKVKKKLAEILPLLNTDEGREALQGYLKEVDLISKHELGLKLLSLFKQYQLADFTVLKTVSDLIQQLEAQDLFHSESLEVLVVEHYDLFQKLSPIIGIKKEHHLAEIYAKILKFMGLQRRHEESYEKFQQLIKTVEQWKIPYKSISIVRQEYKANNYRLPPEFTQKIPGLPIYKKYEKYV